MVTSDNDIAMQRSNPYKEILSCGVHRRMIYHQPAQNRFIISSEPTEGHVRRTTAQRMERDNRDTTPTDPRSKDTA